MQATRHMNLNSGLFFTRANERTRGLMDRIASRLAKEAAWDQSVFNEEIFFLSHDDYVSPNISVRVMNFHKVSWLCRSCCIRLALHF
jgi:arabinosyltransferase